MKGTLRPHPSPAPYQLCDTGKLFNLSVLPFLGSKTGIRPAALLSSEDVRKAVEEMVDRMHFVD